MSKKILIITEKPSLQNEIKKNKILNEYLKDKECIFINTMMISPYTFTYPKNTPYKSYPFSQEAKFKKRKLSWYNEETNWDTIYGEVDKDTIQQFDEIIFAPDADGTGVYSACLIMEQAFGMNWKEHFNGNYYFIKIWALDEESLNSYFTKSLIDKNPKQYEYFEYYYNQGKVKRYFEYNYNLNSNIFIHEVFQYKGKNLTGSMTKYLMMAFQYFYKNNIDGMLKEDLYYLLQNYKGSEKYHNIRISGIGGFAGQSSILEILLKLNLFNVVENKWYLTDLGKDIINLLNSKMFDPDLPYRIHNWEETPYEEAIKSIDTYLITMFNKQKRKNSKTLK